MRTTPEDVSDWAIATEPRTGSPVTGPIVCGQVQQVLALPEPLVINPTAGRTVIPVP